MSDLKELTFQDLAKIGLDMQNFCETNIGVFHSLIDAILRKLDCYDEKVVITGMACDNLLKLLHHSKTASLTIPTTKMTGFSKNTSNRLLALEEKLNILEKPFNEGIDCKKFNDSWDAPGPVVLPIPNDFMMNVHDFIDDTIKYILNKRVIRIERKLEELEDEFMGIILRETKRWKRSPSVENCYHELSQITTLRRKTEAIVFTTIHEIQEIMDAKANNYEIAELKKEILEEFEQIDQLIQERKTEKIEFPALLFGRVATKKRNYVPPKKQSCECDGHSENYKLI